MSTTLQNLIDDCEADLGDVANATFAAEDIEQWCRDAIADYSQHFPVRDSLTITCSVADKTYALSDDQIIRVVSVEFPKGEDPPEYLHRRPYTHPDFWSEEGYYDVILRDNVNDKHELWISNSPTSITQQIEVEYEAYHDNTASVATSLSVPPAHEHVLRKYVRWQAIEQLKAAEEASPTSNSSLLMSQLAINADRARRAYVDALAKAVFADSRSAVVSWADQDQATKRIY